MAKFSIIRIAYTDGGHERTGAGEYFQTMDGADWMLLASEDDYRHWHSHRQATHGVPPESYPVFGHLVMTGENLYAYEYLTPDDLIYMARDLSRANR